MTHRQRTILALAFTTVGLVSGATAQPFAAKAQVSAAEVYMGARIQLYIQVQGTDQPTRPDVSGIRDFTVRYAGTRPSTQRQLTIVNGRRRQTVHRSATIVYELAPKREGALTIPALIVKHGGKEIRTQVIRIQAKRPEKTTQIRLRVRLSQKECYVGEAIRATWTLYFSTNLKSLNLSVPVLKDPRFTVPEFTPEIDPARQRQYRRLRFADFEVIALQGEGTLDRKRYTTLSFEKILIPRVAGECTIPTSTVYAEAVVGRKRTNDFFNRVREVTKKMAAPSNSPSLTVKAPPTEGRPANFSGHVGRFKLMTVADPTTVNVGDPINLTLVIEGPEFLDPVECPDLTTQPDLTSGFKISQNSEPGEVQGIRKVFKRIIRATHPDVTEIPPIELPYFDSAKGTYATARSQAIPLQVRATKVITAQDAEGTTESAPITRKARTRAKGLAANYEDASVLRNQRAGIQVWLASPTWLALLIGMPLGYLVLAIALGTYRRRHADPNAVQARRALRVCLSALGRAEADGEPHDRVLGAIRAFCGAKFGLTAGALTYEDIAPRLAEASVPPEDCDQLRELFGHCEAGRYAGGASVTAEKLITTATELVRRLDRGIGR